MRKHFVFALILVVAGFGAAVSAQTAAFNGGGAGVKGAPGESGSTGAEFRLSDPSGK